MTNIEDLRVGMVVSVIEPDRSIGVYRVERTFVSGFVGSLMGEHAGQDFVDFRVSAYRNYEGYEWFGIPGLTILAESCELLPPACSNCGFRK